MRWVLAVCLGCSDYGISEKKPAAPVTDSGTPPVETTVPVGAPDIEVSPDRIDIAGVCDSGEETLTIANVGTRELTIAALSFEGGWSTDQTTPLMLRPGASVAISLLTTGGPGTLTIMSDDPDESSVLVPLDTREDTPPIVSILRPASRATLPQAVPVNLHARVSDEETPLDALEVVWRSDVDGTIRVTPPDASGNAEGVWGIPRTPGNHEVTVTVTDSCGQEDDAVVQVCQQAGFDESMLDLKEWVFSGSARWDEINEWIELTDVLSDEVGTAFTTEVAVSGDNVEIDFLFYIGDGTGADGISLTALDTDRATDFVGGTGCGIGYGGDADCTAGPALPGWSIEVDTYYNGGQDPTAEDHVMFTFDGDVDDPAIWAELPEMEDTGWHSMKVLVSAPHVTVQIDGTTYIDADLYGGTFSFPAIIGFTAGTGSQTNKHLIDSLVVTEFICPEK